MRKGELGKGWWIFTIFHYILENYVTRNFFAVAKYFLTCGKTSISMDRVATSTFGSQRTWQNFLKETVLPVWEMYSESLAGLSLNSPYIFLSISFTDQSANLCPVSKALWLICNPHERNSNSRGSAASTLSRIASKNFQLILGPCIETWINLFNAKPDKPAMKCRVNGSGVT